MDNRRWLTAALAAALTACSTARDADSVLQRAQAAMGDVRSISYSASGMYARYGQGLTAGEAWPSTAATAAMSARCSTLWPRHCP